MSDVLASCRSTWKRLGVPAAARADLESELRSHLDAAAAEGSDAAAVVGPDAAGFAREWAVARGLVGQRWRVVGTAAAALLASLGWQLATAVLLGGTRAYGDPAHDGRLWLTLVVSVTWGLTLPALVGVAIYLRAARDALLARTLVLGLLVSPVAIVVTATLTHVGFRRAQGSVWYAVVLAMVLGAVRAAVVASRRRPVGASSAAAGG